MRVFILDFAANDHAALVHRDEETIDLVPDFDGTPLENWEPVAMYWETEDGTLPIPDYNEIPGGGLALSQRARTALGDLLAGAGQTLPIEVVEGPADYEILNVTRLSGALDEEASEIVGVDEDDGSVTVVDIDTYVFDPARLAGAAIFKVAQLPEVYTYVTDAFVDRVVEHELTGFDFAREVWSDEG